MAGVTSDSQGACCRGAQHKKGDNQPQVDARLDASTVVPPSLPVAANESCCSARVTGDEIAGTNRSREVGGLGQVLPLIAASSHGRVATGCGCGPDRDAFVVKKEGQPPLGVDSLNRSPLDLVGRNDVANVDTGFSDHQSGSPQCCVDGQCEECRNCDSAKDDDNVACCGGGCCGSTKDEDKNDGQYAARAGYERRHALNGVMEVTR